MLGEEGVGGWREVGPFQWILTAVNTDHLGWNIFLLFHDLPSENFTAGQATEDGVGRFLSLQIPLSSDVRLWNYTTLNTTSLPLTLGSVSMYSGHPGPTAILVPWLAQWGLHLNPSLLLPPLGWCKHQTASVAPVSVLSPTPSSLFSPINTPSNVSVHGSLRFVCSLSMELFVEW